MIMLITGVERLDNKKRYTGGRRAPKQSAGGSFFALLTRTVNEDEPRHDAYRPTYGPATRYHAPDEKLEETVLRANEAITNWLARQG